MQEEKAELELVDTGAKRDGRGRRLETAQEWARILERYDGSGLTQKVFAQREGINYHTLVAWLGRRRRENPGEKSAPAMDFEEYRIETAPHMAAVLEVCLPDGTVVRGANAAELGKLVNALRR